MTAARVLGDILAVGVVVVTGYGAMAGGYGVCDIDEGGALEIEMGHGDRSGKMIFFDMQEPVAVFVGHIESF